MASGIVFNIQKYSVHDGPGIRTLVFLKGCPLRCRWCSNPESQSHTPELGYNVSTCLRCGACVSACPEKALSLTPDGVRIGRDTCRMETNPPCVQACPARALTVYGHEREVDDVLREVEEDSVFYARSGGGMTLSGGEALAQPQFVLSLLREARRRHIHTALETCALAPESLLLEVAGLLDYLLVDIKSVDDAMHKQFTGVPVTPILQNIRAIRAAFPTLPMHIRTPVIPGFNDTRAAIRDIVHTVRDIGPDRFELLPYHAMGEQKYRFLGMTYPLGKVSLDKEQFAELYSLAASLFPSTL